MGQNQISVPLHFVDDSRGLLLFLDVQNGIERRLRPGFNHNWYIDANGCDPNTNAQLRSHFADRENAHLFIGEVGGRHFALNRALEHARETRAEKVIFLNDDVFPTTGLLEDIAAELARKPLVGALSRPIDLRRSSNTVDRNSISQLGEIRFFEEMLRHRGPYFRGDCFGIKPDFVEYFPPIHSDDSYLSAVHMKRFGIPVPVLDRGAVYRYQESDPLAGLRRIQRYIESRTQLAQYCRNHEPDLLHTVEDISRIPDIDELRAKFQTELGRLKEKNDKGQLTSANFAENGSEFANAAMIYFAVKRYLEGSRLIEASGSFWMRK